MMMFLSVLFIIYLMDTDKYDYIQGAASLYKLRNKAGRRVAVSQTKVIFIK